MLSNLSDKVTKHDWMTY